MASIVNDIGNQSNYIVEKYYINDGAINLYLEDDTIKTVSIEKCELTLTPKK